MEKLKEILENLQKSLKGLIPSKKKSKDEDDEDEDEDVGEKTEVSKVMKSESEDEDEVEEDEEEEEDDEEVQKKAKKRKIIQIVIGSAVVLLFASDYLIPTGDVEEEVVVDDVVAQVEEARKRRQEQRAAQQNEAEPTPEVEMESAPVVSDDVENNVVEEEPFVPAPQPTVTIVEEVRTPTPDPTYQPLELGESTPEPTLPEPVAVETPTKANFSLADKVEVELEYQGETNYEKLGRGLVYNCKGKHWACVDRDEYIRCNDNKKFSDSKGENPECVTVEVYAEYEDCKTVQIYNINMAIPTDFCSP